MSLTRAQLLMGNNSQGAVLAGQVQAVKKGNGVTIGFDGTISFDAATATGVVRLNNDTAYNNYTWPTTPGTEVGTFLCISETGSQYILSWQTPSFGPVVTVDNNTPSPAVVGKLWFDTNTRNLKVFENSSVTPGEWTPVSRGNTVDPGNVQAVPAFDSGDGSDESPFTLNEIFVVSGSSARASNVITIIGLAPYQYVPMVDEYGASNGYRFYPTSCFADRDGKLTFMIAYEDFPATPGGQARDCKFRVGFSDCYISASVTIQPPLSIPNPGTISGIAEIGETLTFARGDALGGIPPYTYTWEWKRQSDDSVIQTDGSLLTIPPSLVNNRTLVKVTVKDSTEQTASASTAGYPLSPLVILQGQFPNTVIGFPDTIPGEVSTVWVDEGTALSSSGCIEFKVDSGSYSQGPTAIANGATITTRWITSPVCNGALSGTVISGCVFSDSYKECASLEIDRVPSPFSFTPATGIVPGSTGTSSVVTLTGTNSPAYITYSGSSSASTIEAKINGGAYTAVPLLGNNTLPINPGQTLQVRATTGTNPNSSYVANINIGEGLAVQSAPFALNTGAAAIFTTSIAFPTFTTQDSIAVTWLAADGSSTLTSTGCLEFKVNAGAFSQGPTAITTGDTITTRWSSGVSCGGAPHGTTITGTITDGLRVKNASLTIDRVPTAYSFIPSSSVVPGTSGTSNSIVLVGINSTAYVSYSPTSTATSIQASVDGGAFSNLPAFGSDTFPIDPGQTLQIQATSGLTPSSTYIASINVGEGTSAQSANYVLNTSAGGNFTTPIAFSTYTTQNSAAVTWLAGDGATTLTSTGCIEFKVNAGAFSQGPTAITTGDTITTKWSSGISCGGAVQGTVITGTVTNGVKTNYASLTIDRVPSAYTFTPLTNVTPGSTVTSGTITPSGFNSTAYVSYVGTSTATGIQASLDGGISFSGLPTYVSNTFPIDPGQTLQIKATAGYSAFTAYSANINIGEGTSVQGSTFSLTTSSALSFITNIAFPTKTNEVVSLAPWQDGSTTLTSSGCIEFAVGNGAFSQGPTPIVNGNSISTQWKGGVSCGGAAHETTITGAVTNGAKIAPASLTIDRVPSTWSFTTLTNQTPSTQITSNIITLPNINATSYVIWAGSSPGQMTSPEISVSNGPWQAIPTSGTTIAVPPDVQIQVRATTGPSYNTAYSLTLYAGTGSTFPAQLGSWQVSTGAQIIKGITTPSILTPVNGATGINPYANSPAGITITSSAYTPINGAGTHASTDWEIRKGSTSGTVVFNGNSTTYKTSYFLAASSIDPNSSYFVRCRYNSNDSPVVTSSWSNWSQFNTATTFNLTWVQRFSGGTAEYYYWDVVWVGGTINKFVTVGDPDVRSIYSSDGITWSVGGAATSSNIIFAAAAGVGSFANSVFAVGENGVVKQSVNGGISWATLPDANTGSGNSLRCLVCNPSGRFVACGESGRIRTTTDPTVGWTNVASPVGNTISSVIWDGSRFVATVVSNRILTSPDGITWSASSVFTSIGFDFGQILYVAPSRYVLLPKFSTSTPVYASYAVSTDLSSWTVYPTPAGSYVSAGVVGGGFIALGGYYTNPYSPGDRIISGLSSSDPFNFNSYYSLPNDGGVWYHAMAYSPTLNRFVAAGDDRKIYSTS